MTQFTESQSPAPFGTPSPSPAAALTAAAQGFTTAAAHLAAAAAKVSETPSSTPAGVGQVLKRQACPLPYYPSANAPDRTAYSEDSKTKFYVVGPARHPGAYTDSKLAAEECAGKLNGRMQGCRTWEEAQAYWVRVCEQWHGAECPAAEAEQRVTPKTRIALTPMRSRTCEFWGCKGIPEIFETQRAALDAAEEAGLVDIQIIASYSVPMLEAFVTGD
ncbi:hypothetical protein B0H15DRAFT_957612 [Mycena belliarum]|uniref:Uncharacterized protein n=1 Tax=Mycena belliarum TaxID=1033014 RepID=A0AAD6XE62_9AGAR|nr:hypothetical protein B0H15DRAFT_957612 [Mycena belliae]